MGNEGSKTLSPEERAQRLRRLRQGSPTNLCNKMLTHCGQLPGLRCIALDPETGLLAAGHESGEIKLMGSSGVEILLRPVGDRVPPVSFLEFVPKSRQLISVHADCSMRFWSVLGHDGPRLTGEIPRTWTSSYINSARVCSACPVGGDTHRGPSDLSYLILGMDNGNVRFVNPRTAKVSTAVSCFPSFLIAIE